MAKKILISIIVLIVLAIGIYLCSKDNQSQKDAWTNSSQKLLEMKKMPKKSLDDSN